MKKTGYLLLASLGVSLGCSTAETEGEEYWDVDEQADVVADASARFDCNTLDYGIYWFGPGNVSQKAVAGAANPYYDATRPTVIYVHGWQQNSAKNGKRETFNYQQNDNKNGFDIDTADAWISRGWNIGIFYWTQFADEGEVKDAEAKIWSASGPRGMRWRRCDGSHTTDGAPTVSAGELFYQAYVSALADYRGPSIRIAGHSLGNQMAARLAYLVKQQADAGTIPASLLPDRVALLDPFWSRGGKSFLGNRWTGEVARAQIAELIDDGVIFERYKTSNINDFFIGDSNIPLTDRIGETELVAGWVSNLDQAGRHVAAPFKYFYGFGFGTPVGCITAVCDDDAPSAATSDAQMREYMENAYRWLQSSGQDTERPTDDIIRVRQ